MTAQAHRTELAVRRALEAALSLFSRQGYGATSMRQISEASGLSVGNLYHHFGSKEAIFQRLIDEYFEELTDPGNPLSVIFSAARFPDDLEEMAAAIERSVEENVDQILLIFIDVIEFRGSHIRFFYESMASRFQSSYERAFERRRRDGRLGEVDPLVAVMLATRWLFYFFTVEKCFGVPMHFGMDAHQAVDEFIRILRYGVLPRDGRP
ncbi:MAG TPA: TetR/AcrR family transcriptional regulator, partial [Chondromyces sp.]|nr:TetR/AcrR family transcriptional regulator [Chondromyces sp.]